jgi:hypothetical protein
MAAGEGLEQFPLQSLYELAIAHSSIKAFAVPALRQRVPRVNNCNYRPLRRLGPEGALSLPAELPFRSFRGPDKSSAAPRTG